MFHTSKSSLFAENSFKFIFLSELFELLTFVLGEECAAESSLSYLNLDILIALSDFSVDFAFFGVFGVFKADAVSILNGFLTSSMSKYKN